MTTKEKITSFRKIQEEEAITPDSLGSLLEDIHDDIPTDALTKTDAAGTYQPKGEYLTSESEIEATKLKTPVKIWGKDFDGSTDISGDLRMIANIVYSDLNIHIWNSQSEIIKYYHLDKTLTLGLSSSTVNIPGSLSVTGNISAANITEMEGKLDTFATREYVDSVKTSILGSDTLNESFDTLQEVAEWIEQHSGEASGLISDVNEIYSTLATVNKTLENKADLEEIDRHKKDLFIDMWNRAGYLNGRLSTPCAKYDPEGAPDAEHPYLLNGLYLNFDEAYNALLLYPLCVSNVTDKSWMFYRLKLNCRTLFPIAIVGMSSTAKINQAFESNPDIEVLRFYYRDNAQISNINFTSCFKDCTSLRIIEGVLNIGTTAANYANMFYNCTSLETVTIHSLYANINFKYSPKLSYDSLQYMIKNAANTAAITITVHADIYNALIGEGTEYPFNGGTQEQWQQLMADAIAKNITFATA